MMSPLMLAVVIAFSTRLTVSMVDLDEDEDDDEHLLPVPKNELLLDLESFMKQISSSSYNNKIWSSIYTVTLDQKVSSIGAWIHTSAKGDQLRTKVVIRDAKTGNCTELDGTGKLVKENSNKTLAIYNTVIGKETGQFRFISQYPSEYFWAWYCRGPDISNYKCQGHGTLTLMIYLDPDTKVHNQAVMDDLQVLGYTMYDSRLKPSLGRHALNATMSCEKASK